MAEAGNKTKLFDPITKGILLEAIKDGVPFTHACKLAGICYDTFLEWQKKGSEGKPPYSEFVEQLEKARGEAVEARIKRINEAAKSGSWQADAWWLERQIPSEFGKREAVELTGKDGGAVEVEHSGASTLELLADKEACALASALIARLSNKDNETE